MKPCNSVESKATPSTENFMKPVAVQVQTSSTLHYLMAGVAALATMHVVIIVTGVLKVDWFHGLFFLGFDNNVPARYSYMLPAVAAILAFECSRYSHALGIGGQSVFLVFSALLPFMSCDEIARIHERAPEYLAADSGIDHHNSGWCRS